MTTNFQTSDPCKLNSCLFFSSSKLSRTLKKVADESFVRTGLSPSHAFILYLVSQEENMSQKKVGELLHLSPSTMTRFVDKLLDKKLIVKSSEGKNAYLSITQDGLLMKPIIMTAWESLNTLLNSALTEEEKLTYIQLSNKILERLEG